MSKFLMIPKTKFNPRFHAVSREVEIQPQVQTHLLQKATINNELDANFRQSLDDSKPFTISESPLSIDNELTFGHFYNKIQKDFIRRYKLLRGYNVSREVTLDCYGSKVEHAAFQELLKGGLSSMDYSEQKIRQICLKYVEKQCNSYMQQFNRWGLLQPQFKFTLDNEFQKKVLNFFGELLDRDALFHSYKTIIWSVARQQEVDLDSVIITERDAPAIISRYEIANTKESILARLNQVVYLLIPVTSQWMMPQTQALQIPEEEFLVISNGAQAYVMTKEFFGQNRSYFSNYITQGFIQSQELEELHVVNPFKSELLPIIVTDKLAIVVPGHEIEHIQYAKEYGFSKQSTVNENGDLVLNDISYQIANGDADRAVTSILRSQDDILDLVISQKRNYYNHKITGEELILKSVTGWFVKINQKDQDDVKNAAAEIQGVKKAGDYTDYMELIENLQGEWCVSSQQAWGIPIPLFHSSKQLKRGFIKEKLLGGYLLNSKILNHFAMLVEEHGSDIYWEWPIVDLLPQEYRVHAQYLTKHTKVFDPLFVSGCLALQANHIDLIYEGEDQNETFLFAYTLISILNRQYDVSNIITHPILEFDKQPLTKQNCFPLEHVIQGNVKLNEQQLHGSGVDALRALVATIDKQFDQQDLIFKQQQINFIRKAYWQMLGLLEGHVVHPYTLQELSFNEKYIYLQLVLFVINITDAYEKYNFKLAFRLYIDFMENYLQPFLDTSRNQIISFFKEHQSTLFIYYQLLSATTAVISPILAFNVYDIHPSKEWPKIPVAHVRQAQDNLVSLSLLHKIRLSFHENVQDTQDRVKKTKIKPRIELVFIINNVNSFEMKLLDYGQDQLHEFFGCAKVTIENTYQNNKRPNHHTVGSYLVQEKFLHHEIKMQCRFYFVQEKQCDRCLQYTVKDNQCEQCDSYLQLDHSDIKYIK